MIGPSYETTADAKMYASLGADVVGMSTACEAMALKQMNVKTLAISCVTDYCSNVVNNSTTHEEVLKNDKKFSISISQMCNHRRALCYNRNGICCSGYA